MALEPYVRRVWPETVISWSRLLAGKWMDPLVGRDVLAGAAVGLMTTLLSVIEYQVPQWVGESVMPVPLPSILSASLMLNSTQNYSGIFNSAIFALYYGLILLLCLVLLRIATRRLTFTWIAAVVLFAVATAHYRVDRPWILGAENVFSLFIQTLLALTLLLLLNRHGLVAIIFCLLVRAFLMDFPVTWDFSAWYKGAALAGIVPTVLILAISYYGSRGTSAAPSVRPDQ
jgi:serine/threonine-protein kinase